MDNKGKGKPALLKCPFPNCGIVFEPKKGEYQACKKHREVIADYIWCATHITITQNTQPVEKGKRTRSGLILP